MFHFGFSNEEKAQACLNASQLRRVKHTRSLHTCMKDLNTALYEALRCHDRYRDAMDKVLNLIALHSDTLEDAREQLGDCAVSFAPTHAAAGQLCNAYNAWKESAEVAALRKELDELKALTDSGKQLTKKAKTNVEEMEKTAIRSAAVNSPENCAKIADRSGKAKEKALAEQRDVNAKFATQDARVSQDVQSTGLWWSDKVAQHCSSLYGALSRLAQRSALTFPSAPAVQETPCASSSCTPNHSQKAQPQLPPPPPPPAAQARPPALHSTETMHGGVVPVEGQPVGAAHTAPSQYGGSDGNTAAGVPLEFQTSRANATHTKTVD